MRQLKLFTLLYSMAGIGFATYGFKTGDLSVAVIGFLTFIVALCSSSRWWKKSTLALGKGNVVFGWIVIAILVGLQIYGLITGNFGFNSFLISFFTLTFIATLDAMHILQSSQTMR